MSLHVLVAFLFGPTRSGCVRGLRHVVPAAGALTVVEDCCPLPLASLGEKQGTEVFGELSDA